MSLVPKKQSTEEQVTSKLGRFLFSITRFLVSVFRQYLRFRVWAILIPLLIVIFMGKLLTKDGLLVAVVVLIYILLSFIDKWFENHKEQ